MLRILGIVVTILPGLLPGLGTRQCGAFVTWGPIITWAAGEPDLRLGRTSLWPSKLTAESASLLSPCPSVELNCSPLHLGYSFHYPTVMYLTAVIQPGGVPNVGNYWEQTLPHLSGQCRDSFLSEKLYRFFAIFQLGPLLFILQEVPQSTCFIHIHGCQMLHHSSEGHNWLLSQLESNQWRSSKYTVMQHLHI